MTDHELVAVLRSMQSGITQPRQVVTLLCSAASAIERLDRERLTLKKEVDRLNTVIDRAAERFLRHRKRQASASD